MSIFSFAILDCLETGCGEWGTDLIVNLQTDKHALSYANNFIQVIESLPWPQVYKNKHLCMQSAYSVLHKAGP